MLRILCGTYSEKRHILRSVIEHEAVCDRCAACFVQIVHKLLLFHRLCHHRIILAVNIPFHIFLRICEEILSRSADLQLGIFFTGAVFLIVIIFKVNIVDDLISFCKCIYYFAVSFVLSQRSLFTPHLLINVQHADNYSVNVVFRAYYVHRYILRTSVEQLFVCVRHHTRLAKSIKQTVLVYGFHHTLPVLGIYIKLYIMHSRRKEILSHFIYAQLRIFLARGILGIMIGLRIYIVYYLVSAGERHGYLCEYPAFRSG